MTSFAPRLSSITLRYLVLLFALSMTLSCSNDDTDGKDKVVWVNRPGTPRENTDHLVLKSRQMLHKVGVSVHLPGDYAATDERYPVIYFLHGVGGNEVSDVEGVMSFLQPLLTEHQLPQPIVVFPNGGLSQYQGRVEPMIVKELIPYIDKHYRTLASTESRLVAGFSMGGAGAIRLAIRHPQTFGGALSWAGGMWDKDVALLEAAATNAPTLKSHGFHVLMINGEHDRPHVFAALEEVFNQHSVSNQRVVLEGQEHEFSSYLENSRGLVAEFLQEWFHSQP